MGDGETVRCALVHLQLCPCNQLRGQPSCSLKRYHLIAIAMDHQGRHVELREVGGGWRIFVRQEFDWAVRMFISNENPTKLSQAALETLAVIAYKQPISRGQIASIRAVNVDSVVRTLLSRGLITELYTDSETGAVNFGTTDLMLELLGINSLDELPPLSPHLPDANSDFEL